jgi:3'-phosphoadenosine 5'-phosphosulfate sulfotransferase (PAPS reductase)/FAD synthetase
MPASTYQAPGQLSFLDVTAEHLAKLVAESTSFLDRLVGRIRAERELVGIFALVSGGADSIAMEFIARRYLDGIIHVNTGISVPAVHDFVRARAADVDLPLFELKPRTQAESGNKVGDTYREQVLRWGFPGPAGHMVTYNRLKERQLERFRTSLIPRGEARRKRVLYLTGVRRHESTRRFAHAKQVDRRGSIIFGAPLFDWRNEDVRQFTELAGLPPNPVAQHLHISGECLCGAFSTPGERAVLRLFYPDVDQGISELEAEAKAAGVAACVWGERPPTECPVCEGQGRELLPSGLLTAACAACESTGQVTRERRRKLLTGVLERRQGGQMCGKCLMAPLFETNGG